MEVFYQISIPNSLVMQVQELGGALGYQDYAKRSAIQVIGYKEVYILGMHKTTDLGKTKARTFMLNSCLQKKGQLSSIHNSMQL